jgi:hypothetical protein
MAREWATHPVQSQSFTHLSLPAGGKFFPLGSLGVGLPAALPNASILFGRPLLAISGRSIGRGFRPLPKAKRSSAVKNKAFHLGQLDSAGAKAPPIRRYPDICGPVWYRIG